MAKAMLDWVASLPLWQATIFLFVVVFFRAQLTFWLGKFMRKGLIKSKFGKSGQNAEEKRAGIAALEKYGWPIIPLSFLTVGFQSVVQLGAGFLDWNWLKYTLAALPGYLAWGFIYAFGGLALFRSITNGSIGLLIIALIVAFLVWAVGAVIVKKLRTNG